MAENESTKWLYNKLNAMGYKVGETQEVFDNLMKTNEQSRKWAYEKARERGLNVGGYEEFSKLVNPAIAHPQQSQQSQQSQQTQQMNQSQQPNETVARMKELIAANGNDPEQKPTLQQQVDANRQQEQQRIRDMVMPKSYADMMRSEQPLPAQQRMEPMRMDMERKQEEQELDQTFHPKEVNSEADVLDNYRSRFALTRRGNELNNELDAKSREVNERYMKLFEQTPEYKAIVGKKYSTQQEADEANRLLNETFGQMYGKQMEQEMAPYYLAMQEEINDRYGFRINDEVKTLNKQTTSEQVKELASDVDGLIEQQRKTLKRHAGSGGNAMNALMGSTQYNQTTAEERREMGALESAKKLLEQSQEIIDAAGRRGGTNFMKELGIGVADNFDLENFTFGLAEMAGEKYLSNALEKAEKGEALTAAEEKLLEASFINMATQSYFASDLARGYKAGQVTAESLPFVLEFITNPIASSGNAIAKGLLKYGLKRFGVDKFGRVATSKGAKFAARLLGDAAAALGMEATSSLPRVASGTIQRLNEDYDYRLDDEGNIRVQKVGNTSLGSAMGRSAGSTFFENQSEMVFNAFKGWKPFMKAADDALPGGVNELMARIKRSKPAQLYRSLKDNELFRQAVERAQFHGIGEEYLEEVYNNFANVAMGEMTMEEALDLDNNIDTFLGLAPTSAAFGLIGLGGLAHERIRNHRNMERIFGRMDKEQRAKLEELQRMAREQGNEDIREFIKATMADESLTQEQKRDEIAYAYELAKQTAMDEMEEAQMEDAAEASPEVAQVYEAMKDAEARLKEENPTLYAMLKRYLDDEASESEIEKVLMDVDEQGGLRDLGRAYVDAYRQAKSRTAESEEAEKEQPAEVGTDVQGRITAYREEARRKAESDVQMLGNEDMGEVIEMETALGDEKTVFVTKGRLVFNEDGVVDPLESDETIYYRDSEGKVHPSQPDVLTKLVNRTGFGEYVAMAEYQAAERALAEANSENSEEIPNHSEANVEATQMADSERSEEIPINPETNGEDPSASQQPQESLLPRLEDGSVDYDTMLQQDPMGFYREYAKEFGTEEANNALAAQRDDYYKQAEQAQKRAAKEVSPVKRATLLREAKRLREEGKRFETLVADWKQKMPKEEKPATPVAEQTAEGVRPQGIIAEAEAEVKRQQEAIASRTEEEQQAAQQAAQERIDAGVKTTPKTRRYGEEEIQLPPASTLRETVAREIATGRATFRWKDNGATKGLGAHTTNNENERRRMIWAMNNTEGELPEVVAERIHELLPDGMREQYTSMDVLNEILDLVQTYSSPTDMWVQEVRKPNAAMNDESQADGYEENDARLQLEWEAEKNGMSVEEWQSYNEAVGSRLQESYGGMTDEEFNRMYNDIVNETESEYGQQGTERGSAVLPEQGNNPQGGAATMQDTPGTDGAADAGAGMDGAPGVQSDERVGQGDLENPSGRQPGDLEEEVNRDIPVGEVQYTFTDGTNGNEEEVKNPATKQRIKDARAEVDTTPTDAQKEAGNYRKGHVRIDGYDISIENPKGSVRSGVDAGGKAWSVTMNNDYGYIRGTKAVDGDHIDVFLSENPEEGSVFVIDQLNDQGEFDESKVMYGFNSLEEAKSAYLANYSEGWEDRVGAITEVSKEEFKKWIDSSKRKTKPFSEYKNVKQTTHQPAAPKNASGNRLVTDERYAELKERMRRKLGGQMNMGIDPEILAIGTEMAVYHIEKGARKFVEYAKGMIEDMGDAIRPYLKAFYNGARDLPEMAELAKEMTPYDEVARTDVSAIGKKDASYIDQASQMAREQEVKEQADTAKKAIEKKKQELSDSGWDVELVASSLPEDREERSTSRKKQPAKKKSVPVGDLFAQIEEPKGASKSLLDAVRMLYSKGKEAASAMFQRSFFDVAQTPEFMKKLGLRGDKFTIKYGVISRHIGKDSSHNLSESDWEKLPDAIQHPFAIARLTDKEDSYRIYTALNTSNGGYAVVGADVKNAGREIEVNAISTVFGRRGNANLPQNEEVIYRSEKITPEQSSLLERPNFAQYPIDQESKRQAEREGGELLILTPEGKAASLSALTPGVSSADKDSKSAAKKQAEGAESELKSEFFVENRDDGVALMRQAVMPNGVPVVDARPVARAKDVQELLDIINNPANRFGKELDNVRKALAIEIGAMREKPAEEQQRSEPENGEKGVSLPKSNQKNENNGERERTEERNPNQDGALGEGARQEDSRPSRRGTGAVLHGRDVPDQGRGDRVHVGRVQRLNPNNYSFGEAGIPVPTGEVAKLKANIEAIRTLKEIERSGLPATKEQKEVLSRYVGWGGLSAALDGHKFENSQSWRRDENWNAKYLPYYKELRELLTREEMDAAVQSTNTAHYTPEPVIRALWSIVEGLGFRGGRISEPALGVGHILGLMPDGISANSVLSGFELDSLTGRIAQALYPDANVKVQGYETEFAPQSKDLVITNVPFGKQAPYDKALDKSVRKRLGGAYNLHNYFIAKGLLELKEGGLGVFVTSSATMDGADNRFRSFVEAEGVDLLGAIRLPNDAFLKNAGTSVTADILVFRKRKSGETPAGNSFLGLEQVGEGSYEEYGEKHTKPILVNEYFASHPDMMLGDMMTAHDAGSGGLYSGASQTLKARAGSDLQELLADAVKRLTEGRSRTTETVTEELQSVKTTALKDGTLTVENGKVYVSDKGELTEVKAKEEFTYNGKKRSTAEAVRDYNELKETLKRLIAAEQSDTEDPEPLRRSLNEQYDRFVSHYGTLNRNKQLGDVLAEDYEHSLPYSLESVKRVPSATGKSMVWEVKKGDGILSKRISYPVQEPTRAESAEDALQISLSYRGRIDLPYISSLLGVEEQEAEARLLDEGMAYRDPVSGKLTDRDEYLSGNVKEKLDEAVAAVETNPEYRKNVEDLKKVQPEPIRFGDISYRLGTPWIPTEYLDAFAREVLGLEGTFIRLIPELNEFVVSQSARVKDFDKAAKIGTSRMSADDIFAAALNQRKPKVYDEQSYYDGYETKKTRVVNEQETQAVAEKIAEVGNLFLEYIYGKGAFHREMERIYNEKYNNYRLKEYRLPVFAKPEQNEKGETVMKTRYPNANVDIALREHQAKAVQRSLQGCTLLAHQVGTGKTFTMITTAMEMRRLGLAKKPMIVVQNATLEGFVADFYKLYPGARVLAPGKDERSAENRKRLFNLMATSDFDAIVIPQSFMQFIPDNEERKKALIQKRIDEYEEAISKMEDYALRRRLQKEADALRKSLEEGEAKPGKGRSVKERAKSADRIKARMKRTLDRRTDDVMTFEQLGVDALFIDEAHNFKKIGFASKMNNVKGIDTSASQRANSLLLKAQWVYEKSGGRNVILATGTPITNTMAEVWTMMKFVAPDILESYHIESFDDFATTFGTVEPSLEYTATGAFKIVERFKSYVNVPELVKAFRSHADVVLTEDVKEFKEGKNIPQLKDGRLTNVVIDKNEDLDDVMQLLIKELEAYNKLTGQEKREKSALPLVVFTRAKQAAIDLRLLNPEYPDNPNSKTNHVVRNVLRLYEESREEKGAQLVFCDSYQSPDVAPKMDLFGFDPQVPPFNLYNDIKQKLVAGGIPSSEIAIVSNYSGERREQLFEKVRNGEVRVLLGSTEKMGVGVNVQDRLYALHHIDAPIRPMDFEQRNGRILRQGNLYATWGKPVNVVTYGVSGTLDATAYDRLRMKQGFINQMMKGNVDGRVMEEKDEEDPSGMTFSEMAATLSGDKNAQLLFVAENKVKKLRNLKRSDANSKSEMRYRVETMRSLIPVKRKEIERLQRIADALGASVKQGVESVSVGGETFTEKLAASLSPLVDGWEERYLLDRTTPPLKLSLNGGLAEAVLRFDGGYSVYDLYVGKEKLAEAKSYAGAKGALSSIDHAMKSVYKRLQDERDELAEMDSRIAGLEKAMQEPWGKEEELRAAEDEVKKLKSVMEEQAKQNEKRPATAGQNSEESSAAAEDLRFRQGDELEEVNRRFNEELSKYQQGEMPSNEMLHLGNPQGVMRQFMPSLPIVMRQRILNKASVKKHHVDLSALADMPKYLSSPIFVFKRSDNSLGVLTEMQDRDGKKICVAIELNREIQDGGEILEVNDIRSIHGRDISDIVYPIVQNGTLRWVDKKKGLDYLSSASRYVQQEIDKQALNSATKVVENFENPKPAGEKMRGGEGEYSLEEVAYENDPKAKMLGAPYRSRAMQRRFGERERQRMRTQAEQMAGKLGIDMEVLDSTDGLEGAKRKAKGWYDVRTGRIVLVLPNHKSTADVMETVLHEAVAHYGLRRLFGEHFDTFLDNVFSNADMEVRERIVALAARHGWDVRVATEEYLASLAEQTDFERSERSGWMSRVRDFFMQLLANAGILLPRPIGVDELRYILWRSYENLAHPGRFESPIGEAEDIAKQYELKAGNYREEPQGDELAAEGDVLFRLSDDEYQAKRSQVDEFSRSHLGAATRIILSRGDDVLLDELEEAGYSLEQADYIQRNANDGGNAFYDPDKDAVIILSSRSTSKQLNGYLWHENLHRVIHKLIGDDVQQRINAVADWIRGQEAYSSSVKEIEKSYSDAPDFVMNEELVVNFLHNKINKHGEKAIYQLSDRMPLDVRRTIRELTNSVTYGRTGEKQGTRTESRGEMGVSPEILSGVRMGTESVSGGRGLGFEGTSGGTGRAESGKSGLGGVRWSKDLSSTPYRRALAAQQYEHRMASGLYQAQEALQDSMLSLRDAMLGILKAEGSKTRYIEDVAGFENAYLGENSLSSVNQAECELFAMTLFNPLLDAISKIAKTEHEQNQLREYMMAKHGLERNAVMRQKEQEKLEEMARESFAAYKKEHPKGKKVEDDFMGELRKRDYAGLTSLMDEENVDKAEQLARELVERYEADHGTTELWARTNAVNQSILKKQLDGGLLSQESYDRISGMYSYYIPLRGFKETTSDEAYAYLNHPESAFNAPIRKAHGRTSVADDPIATMQSMAESGIMQANRNVLVKQRFLNFAMNHPSDLVSVSDLWIAYDEVRDEWAPQFPDNIGEDDSAEEVSRKLEAFEEQMKKLAEEHPDKYKHGKEAVNIPYRVVNEQNKRQHQVVVKRGGRDYVLTVNGNPRLAQALNGESNPDNDLTGYIGKVLSAVDKVNRQMSVYYTTMNPNFMVSNFKRDMLYANTMVLVKEKPGYALKYYKNYAKSNPKMMFSLLRKFRSGKLDESIQVEREFKEFILNGGETGYAVLAKMEARKKKIANELAKRNAAIPVGKAMEYLGDYLGDVNRSVELCARFAAYRTSRSVGRSVSRSIYDAKEITVNFNKKGSGSKFMDTNGQTTLGNLAGFLSDVGRHSYVFWNAGVQGTFGNFGKQVIRHPVKSSLVGMASMFTLGAIIAATAGDDDDEDGKLGYYDIPESIRRSHIVFPVGNDFFVRIALPVEYRAFYGLGELMMSVVGGHEHKDGAELAMAVAGQLSQLMPLNVLEGGEFFGNLVPSAARPLVDAYLLNRSWTGLPISKDTPFNQYEPEWQRVYKNTNSQLVALSRWVNEATGGGDHEKGMIDFNPAKVEYLLKQYFGGVATFMDQLVKSGEMALGNREASASEMPLVNRLLLSPDERTRFRQVNSLYYEYKDERDETRYRLRRYEEDMENGRGDYSDRIEEITESPEYRRMMIFDGYEPYIRELDKMKKETSDQGLIDELTEQQNELKQRMVKEMREIDH